MASMALSCFLLCAAQFHAGLPTKEHNMATPRQGDGTPAPPPEILCSQAALCRFFKQRAQGHIVDRLKRQEQICSYRPSGNKHKQWIRMNNQADHEALCTFLAEEESARHKKLEERRSARAPGESPKNPGSGRVIWFGQSDEEQLLLRLISEQARAAGWVYKPTMIRGKWWNIV
jgi:hypothetical protein